MKKQTIISLFIVILLGTGIFMYIGSNKSMQQSVVKTITFSSERKVLLSDRTYRSTIEVGAIGDILLHDKVYEDAATGSGYDFTAMFKPVKELLSSPDYTIANQESIAAGSDLGLSSYPTFNSPYEISDTLKDVGIDLVTLANNHSLDKGEKGILSAID